MKDNIWNKNIVFKERLVMFIVGIITTITASYHYQSIYYGFNSLEKYLNLSLCVIFIVLGIELILLIFNLQIIKYMSLFLSGAAFVKILDDRLFQVGTIILIITLSFFFVIMLMKNIFSTFVTFSMVSLPFAILILILMSFFYSKAYMIIYIGLVVFLLIYKIFGVKINQVFIGKFMGSSDEALMYDELQLKNQLQLIYVIIFIILNITNYFNGINAIYGNLINNSLLTSFVIIEIKWDKIFWSLEKKR